MVTAAAALAGVACLAAALAATPHDNEASVSGRLGAAVPASARQTAGVDIHVKAVEAGGGHRQNSSVLGLLEKHLGHSRRAAAAAFVQTRRASRLRAGARGRLHSADVASAHALLNGMVEQFVMKLDMERIACAELQEKQATMLELARRDLGEYNTQGALARARVLAAQIAISSAEDKLPKLTDTLALHASKCQDDTKALHEQINLIRQDASTLSSVVDMSSCTTSTTASLLACRHPTGEVSLITFSRRVIRRKLSQLRTDTAKRALHTALKESLRAQRKARPQSLAHGSGWRQHQHHRHHHSHGRGGHSGGNQTLQLSAQATSWASSNNATNQTEHPNASEVLWDWRRNQGKCTLREQADCGTLQDKLLLMQMGISEKVASMKEDISISGSMCDVAQRNYRAQIDDLQRRLEDQQASLAEATKVVVEAQEQSRLMAQQLSQLQSEARSSGDRCDASLQELDSQICNTKTVRQELYEASSGTAPFIQDCEVSGWTPEDCTADCGGGVQNVSRSVVVPQSGGAACPPLMMQRRCNEQPCPMDCKLDDWGGWSACSAGCGGGITERVRGIQSQPKHGGKPCGSTFESKSCNAEACDPDCVLSEWTGWSECSKQCDVGFKERERTLLTPAGGQGGCPAEDSLDRLEYMHCNTHACVPAHGDSLRCSWL
ncbi:unnamed protein product [Prorocentrum cordatum]|uniref:Spondin-like TSP1 domain-containing protein n=1 Tax=Prorocentrum cordatum TaxID=2364126 RepID=A0ABN9THP6_9DINO|nr:unnamed protein product [Polarella glacialis]